MDFNPVMWALCKDGSNSWSPSGYPYGWTDLGTIEEVQQGATS